MRLPHHRQLYLWVVIFIFVLATPLIILYARGERFDIANRRLVQTGIFSLTTEPRVVTVTIAGKTTVGRTPLQIRSLLPGRYTVEVSKVGFQTWQKSLVIVAGQTTFLDTVVLIRHPVEATIIAAQNITAAAVSVDGQILVTANDSVAGTTISRSTLDGVVLQTMNIPEAHRIERIHFSPTGKKVLLRSDDQSYIVAVDFRSPAVALETLTPGPLRAIEWNIQNENELLVISARGLEGVDTFASRATLLAPGVFSSFGRLGNQIFVVQTDSDGKQLLRYQALSGDLATLAKLPEGAWNIVSVTSSLLLLHDQSGTVLVFSRDGKQLIDPAFENFRIPGNIVWSSDQQQFATIVGNEVWLGALRQRERVLVGRFSNPPTAVSFLINAQTLLLIYPDHIVATDVDGQDQNNTAVIREPGEPITVVGSSDKQQTLIILESKIGRLLRLALQ